MQPYEGTIKILNENEAYAAWKEADDDSKPQFLPVLVKLLQKHASAVVWTRLGQTKPELVNEAVWTVLERNNTFRGESKFSTWFHGVVNNLCSNELRNIVQAKREVSLENVEEPMRQLDTDGHLTTQQFLRSLTKRQRKVVELRLAGLTRQEIAERMDINEDGVKYILKTLKGRAMEAGLVINGREGESVSPGV